MRSRNRCWFLLISRSSTSCSSSRTSAFTVRIQLLLLLQFIVSGGRTETPYVTSRIFCKNHSYYKSCEPEDRLQHPVGSASSSFWRRQNQGCEDWSHHLLIVHDFWENKLKKKLKDEGVWLGIHFGCSMLIDIITWPSLLCHLFSCGVARYLFVKVGSNA